MLGTDCSAFSLQACRENAEQSVPSIDDFLELDQRQSMEALR